MGFGDSQPWGWMDRNAASCYNLSLYKLSGTQFLQVKIIAHFFCPLCSNVLEWILSLMLMHFPNNPKQLHPHGSWKGPCWPPAVWDGFLGRHKQMSIKTKWTVDGVMILSMSGLVNQWVYGVMYRSLDHSKVAVSSKSPRRLVCPSKEDGALCMWSVFPHRSLKYAYINACICIWMHLQMLIYLEEGTLWIW